MAIKKATVKSLDPTKYKTLTGEEAPEPWDTYYRKALAALKIVCPNIDENDEDVMLAIAMQIQYTIEYQDMFVTSTSLTVGKFSTSNGLNTGTVSPYNMEAITLLISTGKCSLWLNNCKRCGCDDL